MTKIRALPTIVLVKNLQFGEYIRKGIIIPNDDGRDHGIRPRWAEIYSVGKDVQDLAPGDWVLIDHGRWTRKMEIPEEDLILHAIDPEAVLLVSDTDPTAEIFTDGLTQYGQ